MLLLGLPTTADEGDAARFETVLRYLTESSRSAPTEQSLLTAANAALSPTPPVTDRSALRLELLKAQDGGVFQARVLESMLKSLNDPWAQLYTPQESKALRDKLDGDGRSALGISVVRSQTPSFCTVVDVAPGSPADGHLKRGDKILAADGHSPESPEFSKHTNGAVGTTVELTVESEQGAKRNERLTFADYDSPTAYVIDRELGLIRVSSFGKDTPDELRAALKEVGDKPVIIDLRFNGGGYVKAAVDSAELFLERGDKIVTTVGRAEQVEHRAQDGTSFRSPVCLLVNRKTASAAEIFTAALRSHAKAFVVGEKTYGKGSVQRFVELPGQWGLKYTTSLYQTSDGVFIDKIGLHPDLTVEMHSSLMSTLRDAQMAEARGWSKSVAVAMLRTQGQGL